MFHTVYNSYEDAPNGRDYIGKHSTNDPYDTYLGTYKDQTFDPDSKIVMAYAKTAEGALWFEINFHNVFNVAQDPQFANKSKQTSTRFDTTGSVGLREYGPRTQEEKDLISIRTKEAMNTDKVKENLKKANDSPAVKERRRNSKLGIPRDSETNAKVSKTLTGYKQTPEHVKNAAKNRVGSRWWVNEHGKRKFQRECPGEGWILGQIYKPPS